MSNSLDLYLRIMTEIKSNSVDLLLEAPKRRKSNPNLISEVLKFGSRTGRDEGPKIDPGSRNPKDGDQHRRDGMGRGPNSARKMCPFYTLLDISKQLSVNSVGHQISLDK